MLQASDAGKREEENSVSKQEGTVSAEVGLEDVAAMTLEECEFQLKRFGAKSHVTPEEGVLHMAIIERRHKLIGEAGLKQHLANGGLVSNPNSLTEEQALVQKEGQRVKCREIREKHVGLKDRAKTLNKERLFDWVDNKPGGGLTQAQFDLKRARGEEVHYVPENTENNLYRLFDALYVGGEIGEVHYDTAADVVRDENGEEINDRWAPRALMDAARAVQIKKLNSDGLVKALKAWARTHKMNDIRERFLTKLAQVEWDGNDRDETFFIDLLKCQDTPENRVFTRYWLASTYMRATQPGCYCPTSLVLIGGQHSGKSQFWRLVNKAVMCNADASTVNYDPSTKDKTRFLRGISGRAFVGHMGEMKNFGAINTEDWKDFSTGSEDSFDQKYRDNAAVQRQWIFGGDSNEYVGFWRDNNDTDANGISQGERRLWPLFVYQNAEHGDIRWRTDDDAKVDYANFEYEFFQAMKIVQTWFNRVGMEGYLDLVDENTRMVREYSATEKTKDQGTVRVRDFDESFAAVLTRADRFADFVAVEGGQTYGVKFFNADIKRAYSQYMPHGKPVSAPTITKKMVAMGAKAGRDPKANITCYVFDADTVFGSNDDAAGKSAEEWSVAFAEKFLAHSKKVNFD